MSMRAQAAARKRLPPYLRQWRLQLEYDAGARHDSERPLCYKGPLAGARNAPATLRGHFDMYVIDIHYTASLERIDDALERHRAYLQPLLDKGIFIAAGPKVPRAGGVILAARIDRDALEAILQTDPFVTEGLATYRVTEFRITRAATGFNVPALP
ncbi:YCII-like protein [Burkholderia multivorans]|nr:YCII-like protein [Burkholderia multivorans]CAB5316015.1 YCII-like protein [Burkholderia multivorans]CAB5330145.1 YciI-like protein [Burkholderia multivorans]CAB5333804.1 YCII-like protein [Burkholderia multivorans]CAB5338225.1 YCII-like protein [Burkholderia multivorans]